MSGNCRSTFSHKIKFGNCRRTTFSHKIKSGNCRRSTVYLLTAEIRYEEKARRHLNRGEWCGAHLRCQRSKRPNLIRVRAALKSFFSVGGTKGLWHMMFESEDRELGYLVRAWSVHCRRAGLCRQHATRYSTVQSCAPRLRKQYYNEMEAVWQNEFMSFWKSIDGWESNRSLRGMPIAVSTLRLVKNNVCSGRDYLYCKMSGVSMALRGPFLLSVWADSGTVLYCTFFPWQVALIQFITWFAIVARLDMPAAANSQFFLLWGTLPDPCQRWEKRL